MKNASPELEARFDWAHAEARKLGFNGFGRFEQMRRQYGSLDAARMLVISGEFQSGFTWCFDHGRPDITVEQAVIDFADEFRTAFGRALGDAIVSSATWRVEAATAGVR
jgi:hypothetical protein